MKCNMFKNSFMAMNGFLRAHNASDFIFYNNLNNIAALFQIVNVSVIECLKVLVSFNSFHCCKINDIVKFRTYKH